MATHKFSIEFTRAVNLWVAIKVEIHFKNSVWKHVTYIQYKVLLN